MKKRIAILMLAALTLNGTAGSISLASVQAAGENSAAANAITSVATSAINSAAANTKTSAIAKALTNVEAENVQTGSHALTEENAEIPNFIINNEEDFLSFAENCRKNSWSKGRTVILNADITLSNKSFEGIPSFSGTFKGNGYTIYNLSIAEGDEAMGLFRYLEADGKIEKLTVSGTITSLDSRDLIGGIVGVNSGIIEDCEFDGQITGLNVAGGIAGLNGGSGQILNCANNGFITSQSNVGGVAGVNRGFISDCVNKGNVNSDSSWVDGSENENTELTITFDLLESGRNIGGIAGWSNGIIATSTNEGTVGYYKSGENVGGIVGSSGGNVFYCKNSGNVYGKQDVGGIIGQFEPTIVIKGIQEIKEEMDTLHDILDKSNKDIDKASDSFTQDFDELNENSTNIHDAASSITDEGLDVLENNTEVLNDLSERTDYISRHMEPVNGQVTNSLDDLDELNDILDRIDEDASLSKEDKDKIKKSREEINEASRQMQEATDKANEASNEANDILTDCQKKAKERADKDKENSHGLMSDEEYNRKISEYTLEELGKTDFTKKLGDVTVNLTEAASYASTITSATGEITAVAGPYIDSTSDALDKDAKEANSTAEDMLDNIQAANEGTGAILSYLNSKDKLEMMNFTENFDKNMDSLKTEVNSTIDTMDKLNKDASTHSETLEDDMKLINDQMQVVSNLVIDRLDNLESLSGGENIIVDVSERDPYGEACASVTGCVNEGNIDGNTNVGGVVGALAIDATEAAGQNVSAKSGIQSGLLTGSGATSTSSYLGSKYEVAASLRDCKNKGFITFKNKNAGGIAGNIEAGYLADCMSEGGVFTEEGNYLGGIAGYSAGTIVSCNSIAVLSGNEYIGGIAGSADDVHGCMAVPKILASNGRIGAIMGAYQSDNDDVTVFHQGMSDHISNNYFVSEDLFGIDNVSYSDIAEPVAYEKLNEMSSDFKYFKVYFVDENYELVSRMEYRYDADLAGLQYPDRNTDKGTYAEWEKPLEERITSNLVLRSQVVDNVTILASEYRLDNKSFALAEGVFTKEARIEVMPWADENDAVLQESMNSSIVIGSADVTEQNIYPAYPGNYAANPNCKLQRFTIALEKADVEEDQLVKIRIVDFSKFEDKTDEGNIIKKIFAGNDKFMLYAFDGANWQKLDTKEIGSYCEIEMTGKQLEELTICAVVVPANNYMLYWVIAGMAVVIVLAMIMVGKAKVGKKNS